MTTITIHLDRFASRLKIKTSKRSKAYAYKSGYDCGLNGATMTNCDFSIFSSPTNTAAWERGKREAEMKKGNKQG